MTDPIADMLTRIRNAVHREAQRVDVPASRFKAEIARILEHEGYIQGFKLLGRKAADASATAPVQDAAPVPEVRPARRDGSSPASSASAGPGRRVYSRP